MLPGQLVGVALRKRFIEDEVREAIAAGAGQVLVVGAGFDTLGLRLAPELPDVTFVEVDHPATHGVKRNAVEAVGEVPSNLHLVAADLRQEALGKVLDVTETWSSDASSVVVAEGLLMYLAEIEVVALFDEIRRATGPDSRVVLTYGPAQE